jgi:hypothetical protein
VAVDELHIDENIFIKDIDILDDSELEKILTIAEHNNELDEEETLIKNRSYIIKTKIEIILNNIKLNELIGEDKKNEIQQNLIELEDKCNESNNSTILLEILKILDEKYCTYTNIQNIEEDVKGDYLDEIILQELRDDLFNKVTLLLNKNPNWEEYLKPILDELNYTNVTKEYLIDKLDIIKDLEDNEDNENIDYKDQLKNLCLFLKSEIELSNLEITEEKKMDLIELINNTINLLENDNNQINWESELNNFNQYCDYIYN